MRVKADDVVCMPTLDVPADKPHSFVYFKSIHSQWEESIAIKGGKWVVREGDESVVVEGDGVVGQSPNLSTGEHISYNSYHVVSADASAAGAFFGHTEDGEWFLRRIPEFMMNVPRWAHLGCQLHL